MLRLGLQQGANGRFGASTAFYDMRKDVRGTSHGTPPLFGILQRAARIAAASNASPAPLDELVERMHTQRTDVRQETVAAQLQFPAPWLRASIG